jgi:hypothetical protein
MSKHLIGFFLLLSFLVSSVSFAGYSGHVTINVPMFSFNANDFLTPEGNPVTLMSGITSLRTFAVDFSEEKDPVTNAHAYVTDAKLYEFIDFTNTHQLNVIWVLNVTSVTFADELEVLQKAVVHGIQIAKFEFGGEFYLPKYFNGDLDNKKVVEQIRMDGENNDYLDLLDVWVPGLNEHFPLNQYEYVLICASHGFTGNERDLYRAEWNSKVFNWVESKPLIKGKMSYSFHLYGGEKPALYADDEEDVIELNEASFDFMDTKPVKMPGDLYNNWVVTEFGWYINSWHEADLNDQKAAWDLLASQLNPGDTFGIHTFYESGTGFRSLNIYNSAGLTPVGKSFHEWLSSMEYPDTCDKWSPSIDLRSDDNGPMIRGESRTYTFEVYNNDSQNSTQSCTNQAFTIEFISTDGLTATEISAPIEINSAAQSMISNPLTVTIPASAAQGISSFQVKISRQNDEASFHREVREIYIDTVCVRANPKIALAPVNPSETINPGEKRDFNVYIKNDHSHACGASNFNLSFLTVNNINLVGANSSIFNLEPQEESEFIISVKVPQSMTEAGWQEFSLTLQDYQYSVFSKTVEQGVTVTIPCISSAPTLQVTPGGTVNLAPGQTQEYQLNIQSNDSGQCASGTYQINYQSLDGLLSNGQTEIVATINLEAGASNVINLNVKAPNSIQENTQKSFKVKITKVGSPSLNDVKIMNVQINVPCVRRSPIISVVPAETEPVNIGGSRAYNISIENRDSLSCGQDNFHTTFSSVDGLTSNIPGDTIEVPLPPAGGQVSSAINISIPETSTTGSKAFQLVFERDGDVNLERIFEKSIYANTQDEEEESSTDYASPRLDGFVP